MAEFPCPKSDYGDDAPPAASVLSKPRLTLKPSGLLVVPSALPAADASPTARKESSAAGASSDAVRDSSSGSHMGLPLASASADEPSLTTKSAKYLWSARFVCKPAALAGISDADSGGDSKDATIAGDSKDATIAGDSKDATIAGDSKDAKTRGDSKDATIAGDSKDATIAGDSKVAKTRGDLGGCSAATESGFVFGQNLCERVTNAAAAAAAAPESSDSQRGSTASSKQQPPSANGDFVFGHNLDERVENAAEPAEARDASAAALQHPAAADGSCGGGMPKAGGGKSLEDAVSEYEERLRNSGPVLPEVEVVTGEEEESNVMHASGRLFCFDKERSNWVERGRGLLRLNDSRPRAAATSDELGGGGGGVGAAAASSTFRSRIVMRTFGILRVILNTKIWSGMLCEKINQKSLRITGMEDNVVRVFLVTAAPKDVDGLLGAVLHRIARLKRHEELAEATALSATASDSRPELVASSKRKRGAAAASAAAAAELAADAAATADHWTSADRASISPSKKPRPAEDGGRADGPTTAADV